MIRLVVTPTGLFDFADTLKKPRTPSRLMLDVADNVAVSVLGPEEVK
jgi:hypothetical protein